jgi:hypothetical protein
VRAGYAVVGLTALVIGILWLTRVDPPPERTVVTVEGALGLAGADDPGLERRRALAVAERTRACMARRGFEHAAVPEPPLIIPDAELDPIAWAERWGFGVATSVGAAHQSAGRPEVGASPGPSPGGAAYRNALYGDDLDPGCHALATRSVYGIRERVLAPLRDDLAALADTIEGDAAMTPVRTAWRRCATDAVDGLGLEAAAIERVVLPSRLLATFAGRVAASAGDRAELRRVQAVERRVAVAVARCEAAFAAGRAAVAAPHEARFVARQRDALARARALIEAADAALPRGR